MSDYRTIVDALHATRHEHGDVPDTAIMATWFILVRNGYSYPYELVEEVVTSRLIYEAMTLEDEEELDDNEG